MSRTDAIQTVEAPDNFLAGLHSWVDLATYEEIPGRILAMQKIIAAKRDNSEDLDLSSLGLSSIPAEIGNLTNLRILNLSYNLLDTIPAEIGNLADMKNLLLSGNRLTSLPPEIGNLTALKTLTLNFNRLETLPEEIINLTSLTYLNLGSNRLLTLPAEIENFTELKGLNLDHNRLSSIPYSLLTPPEGLKRIISLEFNPISSTETDTLRTEASDRGVTLTLSDSILDKILLHAPEEKKEEIKALIYSEQLPNFKLFLEGCKGTEGWKSRESDMAQCLFTTIDKMSKSEAVKIKCEDLAQTAIVSCVDRIALGFVHMQLALNSEKEVKDMNGYELYNYAKQESVFKFLFSKAEARIDYINRTKTLEDDPADAIETHLAYFQIGRELGLDIKTHGMLYARSSNVTAEDLESAKKEFLELDPDLLIATLFYEDKTLRTLPFADKIIKEVSSREEFSPDEKEGESSQEYNARVNTLPKLVAKAAITEIATRLNELKSRREPVSNPETPESTATPVGSEQIGGGFPAQGETSTR